MLTYTLDDFSLRSFYRSRTPGIPKVCILGIFEPSFDNSGSYMAAGFVFTLLIDVIVPFLISLFQKFGTSEIYAILLYSRAFWIGQRLDEGYFSNKVEIFRISATVVDPRRHPSSPPIRAQVKHRKSFPIGRFGLRTIWSTNKRSTNNQRTSK